MWLKYLIIWYYPQRDYMAELPCDHVDSRLKLNAWTRSKREKSTLNTANMAFYWRRTLLWRSARHAANEKNKIKEMHVSVRWFSKNNNSKLLIAYIERRSAHKHTFSVRRRWQQVCVCVGVCVKQIFPVSFAHRAQAGNACARWNPTSSAQCWNVQMCKVKN